MSETSTPREMSLLDRALRLFGDVRAGEGGTVVLMCVNVFLLLMGYYILKTAREPLILLAGGAELKSYAAAAQALPSSSTCLSTAGSRSACPGSASWPR